MLQVVGLYLRRCIRICELKGLVLYNSIRFAAFETQAMFRQFELYKTNLTPIPFQLLDWTGRPIRHGKRGVIAENTPTVLNRLDISPEHWIVTHPLT